MANEPKPRGTDTPKNTELEIPQRAKVRTRTQLRGTNSTDVDKLTISQHGELQTGANLSSAESDIERLPRKQFDLFLWISKILKFRIFDFLVFACLPFSGALALKLSLFTTMAKPGLGHKSRNTETLKPARTESPTRDKRSFIQKPPSPTPSNASTCRMYIHR